MALKPRPAVTLSGPQTARARARKMLEQNGFEIADQDNPTGLPDTTLGHVDDSVGFLTVAGDDMQTMLEVLEGTNWEIRSHWQGVIETAPTLEIVDPQQYDELEKRIAELEKGRS